MSKIRWVIVLFVAATVLPLDVDSADALSLLCDWRSNDTGPELRECVTLFGVRSHQAALQTIADANGGNRSTGSPGHDASVEYVVHELREKGYRPTVQEFDYLEFVVLGDSDLDEEAPGTPTFEEGTDFAPMDQTDGGDVTAPLTAVDVALGAGNASDSACQPADFAGFPAGDIAVVQAGGCPAEAKAEAAAQAGASGVVLFNQGDTAARQGLPAETLTIGNHAGIPVMGASYAVGAHLAAVRGAVLRLFANTQREETTSFNVLAETATGDPHNVVMVGAHLDSVAEGPGINDDGSGSAAVLETAEQMANVRVRNKVRFAWWSGEELGLVGSSLYLSNLPPDQVDDIALYLNFDMVGSPNGGRFVYDGDGSTFGTTGPAGSGAIESYFRDFYSDRFLASEPTPIEFTSDYAIFFVRDVPFGGVFSGSAGIKSDQQARLYGGRAGQPYDPCYHSACDTFGNVDLGLLDLNADAIATATLHYSMTTAEVTG
ncbi:MAG TPA: M28 family peptidase [Acidimicrobiales bacterium]|nr:M28 family peptidase [Acidimicrobiales bacterium]